MRQTVDECPEEDGGARRHPAGGNPAKRAQILEGAERAFLEKGFDAATMNDVRRFAGVSKSTIYVYFHDKADLFEALIAEKRELAVQSVTALFQAERPLEEKLRLFGMQLCAIICSEDHVRAQRTVAGAIERMPDVGVRFYDSGSMRVILALAGLLEREGAAGRLDVPDAQLASAQFLELASAGLWRARMFGKLPEPPCETDIARTVDAAVTVFMRAYRAGG